MLGLHVKQFRKGTVTSRLNKVSTTQLINHDKSF